MAPPLHYRLFGKGHEPLGEFTIPVKLRKDVTAQLKVIIEREAAE